MKILRTTGCTAAVTPGYGARLFTYETDAENRPIRQIIITVGPADRPHLVAAVTALDQMRPADA
jgi:hypothetical protein